MDISDQCFELAALQDAAALLDDAELVEEFQKTDRLPYGLELWPASVALARYIYADEPGDGRHAMELGCGVGLVSLAAARRAWRVTATDVDPVALRFAEFNAAANGVSIHEYRLLDWNHAPEGVRFSRIFAADVLYQLSDHRPLLRCIAAMLDSAGVAYVSDPCRGVADRFPVLAEQAGFHVSVMPTSIVFDNGNVHCGRLFVLKSPPPSS